MDVLCAQLTRDLFAIAKFLFHFVCTGKLLFRRLLLCECVFCVILCFILIGIGKWQLCCPAHHVYWQTYLCYFPFIKQNKTMMYNGRRLCLYAKLVQTINKVWTTQID